MHASKITRARITLAAVSAAFVVLLVPVPSHAGAEGATKTEKERLPSYPALMEMKPTDVMDMMDKGKKGYVTRDEFMKFYEALFQRLDRDKTGKLTERDFTDRG